MPIPEISARSPTHRAAIAALLSPDENIRDAGPLQRSNRLSMPARPHDRTAPMGRPGEPGEVARLVRFLAGDESSFVTGEDFVIDRGFTAGTACRRVAVETGSV